MAIMFDCLRNVASVININLGSTGHGFALLKQTMDLRSHNSDMPGEVNGTWSA